MHAVREGRTEYEIELPTHPKNKKTIGDRLTDKLFGHLADVARKRHERVFHKYCSMFRVLV